jgi:FkbM family methyltransferase
MSASSRADLAGFASRPDVRPAVAPHPGPARPGRVLRQIAWVIRFVWTHPSNRSRRLRRLMRAIVFQVGARLLRSRSMVVPFGERSRLRALLHVYSSTKALYANPPDWPEMLVWKRYLRPGDLFVDVGANVGVYSVWAADLGARVIAVEPNADAAERLRENAELNGYEIRVAPVALSDAPGFIRFTTGLDMSNHVVDALEAPGTELVPASTLDALLGDATAAGVKIDVEGAESLVLRGATRALGDHRIKLLQLEWNDCSRRLLGEGRDATARLLQRHGYQLCVPDGLGFLTPVDIPEEGADVFARPIDAGGLL